MLTNALKTLIYELFLKYFIKNNKWINIFYGFHENCIKTFLK